MKGIVLAAGTGSRFAPVTLAFTKHFFPAYDKPVIYYPICVLMIAGIRDILLICKSEEEDRYKRLLGDGSEFGVSIQYSNQDTPKGIAEAFLIGKDFIADQSVMLILGDNLLYGPDLGKIFSRCKKNLKGAYLFGYEKSNPEGFGVINLDSKGRIVSLEEKPEKPKSKLCSVGLYMYDNTVVHHAETVRPSWRNELEILSINESYFKLGQISCENLSKRIRWFDIGTPDGLLNASYQIRHDQNLRRKFIGNPKDIAIANGWN